MRARTSLFSIGFLTLCNSVAFECTAAADTPNYCKTIPIRSDAVDWPSKHAWDLFVRLNHPAKDKTLGRGLPDCTKPLGSPSNTAVWETWRNAGSEVYLSSGAEPPLWDDTSLPDEKPGQTPATPVAGSSEIMSFHDDALAARKGAIKPQFSPDDGVFQGSGGFGETRLNRATYEFIRQECLFSREGQQRYAVAVGSGLKPPVQFPVDSIEVKAAWLDFDGEKVPQDKRASYYTAVYKGKSFGLVAWHVITKDVPVWFWASFHHKDAPANKYEQPDTYGAPADVKGTVWENYRLGGTQNDFTSPSGSVSILSDHYVEFGFQRSSCITCHSTASISTQTPMPNAQQKALCALTPTLPDLGLDPAACKKLIGSDAFVSGTDNLVIERGVPDPRWFTGGGGLTYLQTDFVFSIPFRGRKEQNAAPTRCIWK